MKWEKFHHPDLSLPVVRRKAGDELLTLLSEIGSTVLSGGASMLYGNCYPNTRAFKASISRLKTKGLVVQPKTDGSMPSLQLTDDGRKRIPAYCTPHQQWNKRWGKCWYILMFDVPEASRPYRDTLRGFLKKQRFGCLQRSVWVTPRDVRPEYDDLDRAAAVDSVAFLFEAQTVLGHGNQSVVQEAWNFGKLNEIQSRYIAFAEKNLVLLKQEPSSPETLAQLLRMDNQAYAQAMATDPLLPNELLPKDYLGKRAFDQHHEIAQSIAKQFSQPLSRKNSRS